MAWRSGSLSRTVMNAARSPAIRPSSAGSATGIPRFRRPASPLLPPRRFSFSNPRTFSELGGIQSLMPLHSVMADARLTSHVAVDARACCELSQGTFRRTCQDR